MFRIAADFIYYIYPILRGARTDFFQAEDGIRDRSPSRGLGDVYKRQSKYNGLFSFTALGAGGVDKRSWTQLNSSRQSLS